MLPFLFPKDVLGERQQVLFQGTKTLNNTPFNYLISNCDKCREWDPLSYDSSSCHWILNFSS